MIIADDLAASIVILLLDVVKVVRGVEPTLGIGGLAPNDGGRGSVTGSATLTSVVMLAFRGRRRRQSRPRGRRRVDVGGGGAGAARGHQGHDAGAATITKLLFAITAEFFSRNVLCLQREKKIRV